MRTTQSINITLPTEMAQMIKDKVASGEYADEGEVVRDGLRSLAARDAAVEEWLREEVIPVAREIRADPGLALSAEETWKRLQNHMGASEAKNRSP